ncbi:MAG: DUF3703 domain-containing protein [Candidatus Binatia bacterium]
MSPRVREAFEAELAAAQSFEQRGDDAAAWRSLERSHILSQRWTLPHLRSHFAMLGLAWRSGDAREMAGQGLRLLFAAPGSLLGRAPLGNTGRSNVGIFTPMALPPELENLLSGADDPT